METLRGMQEYLTADAYQLGRKDGHLDRVGELLQKARHGVTCPKAPHVRDGYLHGEDDDTPYNVDGASYCGRCHMAL
jgi:hypothetical protein